MGGATHDFAIDDNFVYACASMPESKKPGVAHQEVVIIDYRDPKNPKLAGRLHLPGQHVGEEPGVRDRLNPDGSPQKVWCQQITIHKTRVYVGWRDAGLGVVDVTDPSKPRLVGQLDYVPPFNGGAMGAAHSAEPVVVDPNEHPDLVVLTDESFDCPPGIGRIVDVSDLKSPDVEKGVRDANLQIISSYRIPHVSDVFNFDKGKFECLRSPGDAGLDPEHQGGQQSVHYPWFDHRSPSLFTRPGTIRAFGCGISPIRFYRGRLDTTCPRNMHPIGMLTGKPGRFSRTRITISSMSPMVTGVGSRSSSGQARFRRPLPSRGAR